MAEDMSLQIGGLDKVLDALGALPAQLVMKAANALRAEAEIEMTEAKQRTPVKTGTLRASGHVTGPTQNGNDIDVTLTFGGPAAEYAVFVHENVEAYHRVGQAKFLESTVLESAPHLADRIATRMGKT